MRESADSTYLSMREAELEALRRKLAQLEAQKQDLEQRLTYYERRDERRLRSVK